MVNSASTPRVITHTDLRAHFRQSVDCALTRQRVKADEDTAFYLVNLLASFVHTAQLFEPGDESRSYKPLALLYAEAVHSNSPVHRYQAMRRLGDVALFVAGVFSDSLRRRVVDVDYYIAMGGNAYAYLSEDARGTQQGRVLRPVFRELARRFTDFVDVLNEVSESAHLRSQQDVLRLYELWLRTGSRRAAAKLRALHIEPIPTPPHARH